MIPEKVYFQQGYPVDAFHNQHWGMLGTVEIGETDKEAWDKMRLRCEEMWKRYMIENNPKFYYGVLQGSGTITRTFTDEDLPVMNKDGAKVKSWKPAHIKKLISLGDKRSYNEISADLELEIWTERHHGEGSVSSQRS